MTQVFFSYIIYPDFSSQCNFTHTKKINANKDTCQVKFSKFNHKNNKNFIDIETKSSFTT